MSAPEWLHVPADVNALIPQLWPRHTARNTDGVVEIAGKTVHDLKAEFGTPAFVLDEDDMRARARAFRDAFHDADVYYAGKAFLCKAVVRIIAEEGLHLDVCSGGELATALAAGMDRSGSASTGTTSRSPSWSAPCRRRRPDHRRLRPRDRPAQRDRHRARGNPEDPHPGHPRVEAHTHEFIATAHEDQKFGFSIAGGAAYRAALKVLDLGHLELRGFHSHIGSQIFDTSGFELAARRVLELVGEVKKARGVDLPELDLGGGFGIAYTTQDDPSTRTTWPSACARSSTTSAPRRSSRSRTSRSSPAAPSSDRPCSRSTRSARSRNSRCGPT